MHLETKHILEKAIEFSCIKKLIGFWHQLDWLVTLSHHYTYNLLPDLVKVMMSLVLVHAH